jgi:hypothetical protein
MTPAEALSFHIPSAVRSSPQNRLRDPWYAPCVSTPPSRPCTPPAADGCGKCTRRKVLIILLQQCDHLFFGYGSGIVADQTHRAHGGLCHGGKDLPGYVIGAQFRRYAQMVEQGLYCPDRQSGPVPFRDSSRIFPKSFGNFDEFSKIGFEIESHHPGNHQGGQKAVMPAIQLA